MAFGAGGLWVADPVDRRLFEIDPAGGTVRRTLSVTFQPSALIIAAGALWVSGYDRSAVEKIDPISGRPIGRVQVGSGPVALVSAAGSVWAANGLDATVSRIDPVSLKVLATIPVGGSPSALAAAAGYLWVGNASSDTLSRIDPRRNVLAGRASVGGAPTSLAVVSGRVWAAVDADVGRHRGGTLTVVGTEPLASIDPAMYAQSFSPQFIGLTYDTLVTFEHRGTGDGLHLVPDLARTLPTVSRGGATYTFHLRPGVRYSDDRSLRASDFRRAFERLFRLHSPGAPLFDDVRGTTAAGADRRRAICLRGSSPTMAPGQSRSASPIRTRTSCSSSLSTSSQRRSPPPLPITRRWPTLPWALVRIASWR